ncbi:MAG: diadenylate cyclase CdaA [Clostridiales bacterium]|nr:diadenylate cyclase CdaA [Clostridiales bacterium]MCD7828678.1 diadenylate cyclase CdaA [Clostridiales bacterium]
MNFAGLLSVSDTLSSTWDKFSGAVMSFNSFKDVLDVLFVAVIVYYLILQIRRTQSIQIISGVVGVVIIYMIVNLLEMNASKYIFNTVFGDLLVILVIIFSDEIRQALERMGRRGNSIMSLFSSKSDDNTAFDAINSVCRACAEMSEDKIGSLIVFQRKSMLGDLTRQSVPIDSCVTEEMLCSIFFPKAALHDGAIVIKDGRIVAARCVVPLKNEKEVTEHVGTRHRAALEVSLHSDAVAVVTSEETGIISIAYDGQLIRGLTDAKLREMLISLILDKSEDDSDSKNKKFRFPWAKKKKGAGKND